MLSTHYAQIVRVFHNFIWIFMMNDFNEEELKELLHCISSKIVNEIIKGNDKEIEMTLSLGHKIQKMLNNYLDINIKDEKFIIIKYDSFSDGTTLNIKCLGKNGFSIEQDSNQTIAMDKT